MMCLLISNRNMLESEWRMRIKVNCFTSTIGIIIEMTVLPLMYLLYLEIRMDYYKLLN